MKNKFTRLTEEQLNTKCNFIENHLNSQNAASGALFDSNANVSNKNVATMEAKAAVLSTSGILMGKSLVLIFFEKLIIKYSETITCILFMRGERSAPELFALIEISKKYLFKTALYPGLNEKQVQRKYPELLNNLDFIKTGKWILKLGELNSKKTNQILTDLKTGEVLNKYFIINPE